MKMRCFRLGLAGLVVLLAAACTTAPSGTTGTSGGAATSGATTTASTLPAPDLTSFMSTGADSEYRIGPLDLLEISVFQVPELNKTVKVNASGQIGLPLIGMVTAGGKTVSELETEIASKLGANYLQSPQVTVFVRESTSQRVTVDGAVGKPGVVSLNGPTSLLQTLAMSGGTSRGADPAVLVFRTSGGQKMAAKFNIDAIRAGKAADPQLYGGDIVVVDRSAVRTALSDFKSTIPVFSFFMPFI